ncbi:MAG: hypothetical protein IVW52_08455, partial [Acidimicrobiales bacterium]|nr:hypothetical protein [Acidimicrobiales bacterium]
PSTAATAHARPSDPPHGRAPPARGRSARFCSIATSAAPTGPISSAAAPAANDNGIRTTLAAGDGSVPTAPVHRGAAPAPARARDPDLADGARPDARGNGLGQSSAGTGGGRRERASHQEGPGETPEPLIGRGVHRPSRCPGPTTTATPGSASTAASPGAGATGYAADAAAATAPATAAIATASASAAARRVCAPTTRGEADRPGFPGAAPPASS